MWNRWEINRSNWNGKTLQSITIVASAQNAVSKDTLEEMQIKNSNSTQMGCKIHQEINYR